MIKFGVDKEEEPFFSSAGNLRAHNENWRGNIEGVYYVHGATVVRIKNEDLLFTKGTSAYTYGSYIMGKSSDITNSLQYDNKGKLTYGSSVLLHEYGHYLQSQKWGTYLLLKGGLNSSKHNDEFHDSDAWSENDADARTLEYFNNLGISTQNFYFYVPGQQKRKAKFGDYFLGIIISMSL